MSTIPDLALSNTFREKIFILIIVGTPTLATFSNIFLALKICGNWFCNTPIILEFGPNHDIII